MTARCRCGSGRRTRSPTPPGRMPTWRVGGRRASCSCCRDGCLCRRRTAGRRGAIPGAAATDAADLVPIDRLDALAAAGFYGLAGPTAVGGLGHDAATVARVVETLASGCVTTTFVWLQHHGPVRAVAAGAPELRTAWLATMCAGR